MRGGDRYREGGLSYSVRLDYRWTALVSRNCTGNNAPPLVAQGQPLHRSHKLSVEVIAGSKGHNSLKIRVSMRFFALTVFGKQWYRPPVPRKNFHVSSG